jgi:nitrite reductase/ring-hydroxylating ferredoxin subunit
VHGAAFDLRTGKVLCRSAVQAVAAYDVQIEGQAVLIARRPIGW